MKKRSEFHRCPAFTVLIMFSLLIYTSPCFYTQASASYSVSPPVYESAATHPPKLIPLGRAVGIKLFSDGVMVVGLSEVNSNGKNMAPARDCGLQEGDIITHINSREVDTIEQVQRVLNQSGGNKISIRATRGDENLQLTTNAVRCSTDGQYKLGAWIRDSMAGIGTMTFYDPERHIFGALGHGINDVDTKLLMPLESGSVMYAEVSGVKRGTSGTPGELHGKFNFSRELGQLYSNTKNGIFGSIVQNHISSTMPALDVCSRDQVTEGPVQILSNISGDHVESYTAEITKIYPSSAGDSRNMMLHITDPELLNITGGIVQGMSGSPILQNGKLVGAVTHV